MLANSPDTFHSSCELQTGLSNFHKMTAAVMKMKFEKLKPRIEYYREYKSTFFF